MLNLLRKECLVTRWVHVFLVGLGLLMVFFAMWEQPRSISFVLILCQMIYSHMLLSMNCQTKVSRPDNLLLLSLPTTRKQIIDSKYLFVLLCEVLYPACLCALAAVMQPLVDSQPLPMHVLWLMAAILGVVYQLVMMPISYVDPRYGAAASMVIYLAVLILPNRLGKGISAEKISEFFARISAALNGFAVPMLLIAVLLALGWLSLTVSRRLYQRAEF